MWFSDKPLIQDELSTELADMIHIFNSWETSLLYFEAGMITLQREWSKLDHFRFLSF
jgi:hypothetical protein